MGQWVDLVDEVHDLDDDAVIARFRDLELALRRQEAELAAVIAEVERRRLFRRDGHHTMRNWMLAEGTWSSSQVIRRRRLAALVTEIDAVGAALVEGTIGVAQVDELARVHANPRCGDQLADAADTLVEQCEVLSFDDARTCVRQWETLADLDGAHRDRASSEDRRRAHVGVDDDGLVVSASGGSAMDAAEMQVIFDAFVEREFRNDVNERTITRGPDAPDASLPRTAPQRRFDALAAIFRAAAANPTLAPRVPVVVNLLVDQWTFHDSLYRHGLTATAPDPARQPDPSDRRCATDDGIPVLPDDALRAALDGHIRRIVMDSDHVVIDAGRRQRLFTGAARDIARILATRCECPGCTVKARFAQVDHLTEWLDHGETALANADAECGRHNRHKHRAGWTGRRRPDGQLNWYRRDGTEILPAGRRHRPDIHELDTLARQRLDALRPERRAHDRPDDPDDLDG